MITVCVIFLVFMSIVAHEVAHGYVAYRLGDSTAKEYGRLTLNPWKHVDLVGTIMVPLVMYFISGFIFGWAKPVPVDTNNFKNPVKDMGMAAAAGPVANVAITVALGFLVRTFPLFDWSGSAVALGVVSILVDTAYINILLALINLIPITPLDGSRMLFAVLPQKWQGAQNALEKYSMAGMFIAFGIIFACFGYFQYTATKIIEFIFG